MYATIFKDKFFTQKFFLTTYHCVRFMTSVRKYVLCVPLLFDGRWEK